MAQTQTTAPLPEKAARLATQSVALKPTGLLLLGTFGSAARPGALLRLEGGETARVTPGDSLGDGTVLAIADGRVVIETAGQTVTLRLPESTLSPGLDGQLRRRTGR
ncbi:MAG: pilus assembly protein PilZ [Paracoccaceae bacterium]